jgi:hypothetical protein
LTEDGRRTAERLLELYGTIDGSAVHELAHAAVPDHATVAEAVLTETGLTWEPLAYELRWLLRNRWDIGEPHTVKVIFTAGAIQGAVVALSLLPGQMPAEDAHHGEIDGASMREAAFRTIPDHAASAVGGCMPLPGGGSPVLMHEAPASCSLRCSGAERAVKATASAACPA